MSSVPSPTERNSNSKLNFTREIQCMMHAFGDNPVPLLSSVNLVETVVTQQMQSLLHQADEVATMRGAKTIGVEDFLFLMRKEREKINRFLNYLFVKEMKPSLTSAVYSIDPTDDKDVIDTPGKMRKRCIDFLKSIDQTGELTEKCCQPFDSVKHERNVRAELMSQNLDESGYLEYSNARRISFTNKFSNGGGCKLRDWLLSNSSALPELPKPTTLEYEMLCYLAYETVAQVVDLALLVRQDAAVKPGDEYSYHVAGFSRKPGAYPPQQAAELTGLQIGGIPPLTPAEIKEALRRYWSPQVGPFSAIVRPSFHGKLLAC